VRLYNRYDAIVSVANYLKEHGWRMDLPDPQRRLIIGKYNNSSAYTDTVLELSRMIRGQG
jgi:membrane-bound lytic murein transglycosylase B